MTHAQSGAVSLSVSIPIGLLANCPFAIGPLPRSADGEPVIRTDGVLVEEGIPTRAERVRRFSRTIREFLDQYRIAPRSPSALLHWRKLFTTAEDTWRALPEVTHETEPGLGSRTWTATVGHELDLKAILELLFGWRSFMEDDPDQPGQIRPSAGGIVRLGEVADRLDALAPKFEEGGAMASTRDAPATAEEPKWITLCVAAKQYHVSTRTLRQLATEKQIRSRKRGPHENSRLEIDEKQIRDIYPARDSEQARQ